MKSMLNRYYYAILSLLGASGLVFSYILGLQQGRVSHAGGASLQCSDTVLEQLKIPLQELIEHPAPQKQTTGKYVGSKNGTKYYTPNCSALKRIKPENYVWFKSVDDAKLQGYTPGRC